MVGTLYFIFTALVVGETLVDICSISGFKSPEASYLKVHEDVVAEL